MKTYQRGRSFLAHFEPKGTTPGGRFVPVQGAQWKLCSLFLHAQIKGRQENDAKYSRREKPSRRSLSELQPDLGDAVRLSGCCILNLLILGLIDIESIDIESIQKISIMTIERID